jgi:5-methylthioadenosine/S-adenosylhomocysteine deaminase
MSKNNSVGENSGKSRRGFLKGSVGLVAGAAAAQVLPSQVAAQNAGAANAGLLQRLQNPNGRAILLKDGVVLSLDRQVGDFEKADVLIQGKKIVSVGPNLAAPAQAITVNAAGMIVMPGFIDTHHHQYMAATRSLVADSLILSGNTRGPKTNFSSVILQTLTPAYRPEDVHICELVASLNQISAGVTMTVDTSDQITNTPERVDAAIAGLKESGRRALFNVATAGPNSIDKYTAEMSRLRKQYFSSDDQLLTLAAAGANVDVWKVARSFNAPIVAHFWGGIGRDLQPLVKEKLLGPDIEFIHFTQQSESNWKAIADNGVKLSIAPAIEMQMRHGHPPFQEALDHGIRPALSVDVECNMTADFFTMMRSAYTYQRAMINDRVIAGEQNVPPLLTSRDVIELATIEGAKCTHLDSKIGTLTPGKEADIIMLATNRINVFPLNNVPGTIVTLMDTSNVENVFIAGKVVKWQGQLPGVDLNRLGREIEKSRDGILARANYPRDLFGTCCTGPEVPGGK